MNEEVNKYAANSRPIRVDSLAPTEEDEDKLSRTPDWINEIHTMNAKHGSDLFNATPVTSESDDVERPSSPGSPLWATDETDFPDNTSSPNVQYDNTPHHHLHSIHVIGTDEDDDYELDEQEAQQQPELYSEEYDDAITLSETHLFRQILRTNVEQRQIGITNVIEVIKQHAEGHSDSVKFFNFYQSIISRFAYDCPFSDICSRFQELVKYLAEKGITIRKAEHGFLNAPSYFFSPLSLEPIDSDQPIVQKHFKAFFLENGVVSHLPRVLVFFPEFTEVYYKAYHFTMKRDGPLPVSWRNYIAIMAASRHQCNYLIRRQESEFLVSGGDPQWLRGVKYAPLKLQSLLELNAILAHTPWKLRQEHVERLVKPTSANQDYTSLWSIAELVHAVVILCHFHSLSGFVFGCGLLQDDDTTPVSDVINDIRRFKEYKQHIELNSTQKLQEENVKVLQTLNKLNIGDYVDDGKRNSISFDDAHDDKQSITSELQRDASQISVLDYNNFDCFNNPRYASMMYWAMIPTDDSSKDISKRKQYNDVRMHKRYLSFGDRDELMDISYTNFDVRSKDYSCLFAQEYDWTSHSFPLLNRFYNGYADLLDTEFNFIRNMTENNFYKAENVDTTAFRMAIWLYVQRLYGMMQDDYDYQHVNRLLNIGLKKYIKSVVCYPEKTEREQFVDMGFQFKTKEKIHVNLIATEARKQMELVYALKQISSFVFH